MSAWAFNCSPKQRQGACCGGQRRKKDKVVEQGSNAQVETGGLCGNALWAKCTTSLEISKIWLWQHSMAMANGRAGDSWHVGILKCPRARAATRSAAGRSSSKAAFFSHV
jgi:hypothetical protein